MFRVLGIYNFASDLECEFSTRNWKWWYVLKSLSVVGGKNRGKTRIRVIGQYRTVFNLNRLVKSESEKRGRSNHLGTDLPFTRDWGRSLLKNSFSSRTDKNHLIFGRFNFWKKCFFLSLRNTEYIKTNAIMRYTNSSTDTVAREIFSFFRVLILFWCVMRNYFCLLYFDLCASSLYLLT